jgi:hypothetical protein
MRFVLTLSPEPRRGFSGEGAVLDALATDSAADDADLIGALLRFESRIEPGELADRSGLTTAQVTAALTQLGTAGRVGYDTAEAGHFHRELPYHPERVAQLNPRLVAARALADHGAVRFAAPDVATVTVAGRQRQVRFTADDVSCTCPWWAEHRGSRGPCKHVLAARMSRGDAG